MYFYDVYENKRKRKKPAAGIWNQDLKIIASGPIYYGM